jgi:lysyl-tRNA synthetase class 2
VYLRIADELYLKRLVIGGLDRVYEIGHSFRNEGVSRKRNPEFTMMECYQAYADYTDMMELVQALFQHVVRETQGGKTEVAYRGDTLHFSGEWKHLRLVDAIREATDVDVLASPDLPALRKAVIAAGLDPGEAPTWGQLVDHVFSEHVEPKLVQPTFIVDYPVELSPLAKRSPDDPRLAERFELFIGGMEAANAFSELNDPDDQLRRFEEQVARKDPELPAQVDHDYVDALAHGMPPAAGIGIGVDRLAMLLTGAESIRDVILFPLLRPQAGA